MTKERDHIEVRGAAEHNLKHIDIDIPKKSLVVITGVSGSGKSSLAFDTIYAEGQRRYVESLSAYARQFLGQMEKPKYETIKGLAPTIAIEQKSASKNPRSTVGTITEIYDYLRVLYARVGEQYCHICGKKVGKGHVNAMVKQIQELPDGTKFLVLAPLVESRKGEHKELFDDLKGAGFTRVRVDGVVRDLADVQTLAKHKKHTIEVVVDRLQIASDNNFRQRLTDSVETALKRGQGKIIIHVMGREDIPMNEAKSCCGFAFPDLDPPRFSFNSPLGMCTQCNGLGSVLAMDIEKIIPDETLSIREGAILPWKTMFEDEEEDDSGSWGRERIRAMESQWGLDIDVPWKKLPKSMRDRILHGTKGKKGLELTLNWQGKRSSGQFVVEDEGLLNRLWRRYQQTQSERQKEYYGKFLSNRSCETCGGKRLRPEILAVKVYGRHISDVSSLSIRDAYEYYRTLKLKPNDETVARELLKEIVSRLSFLVNVGLGYLSLDRKGPTLSGGEAQRIRLASQIGSELTGVLYVLDEPSIGLHQRDNQKLLQTLCHLRDIGNTLLVVEHDQETMQAADWLIDMGPGAGHLGGQVVAAGSPNQVAKNPTSLTGKYLSGKLTIPTPPSRRQATEGHSLKILGARANNLKNIDLEIPLGMMVGITGVSGAGKSSLINQILYPALARKLLAQEDVVIGEHDKIVGIDRIDKVINIDQQPIGRTPRSNPATYTKVFDLVRDFFAMLPESRSRGYEKGRFSFNVKGGRCEKCMGDGSIKVEMHFLADVYVVCEECRGKRFNDATLEVKYRDHSIADVLELSVDQAIALFKSHIAIQKILQTLVDVGLGYIKLGQSATTLSGGEAQRVKLAKELARRDTGKTLYILDEPTTGLHFDDIRKLLTVLQSLVAAGNSVVVIEHNLDVIKTVDWIIDLGPEGGQAGGQIIATGTPEQVMKHKHSETGRFLKEVLH
jgi:excinuclease ABC subunit A